MDVTFFLFFIALLVSIAAWCVFLWAIRTGQFHDVEGIKFQVWPAPAPPDADHSGPPTENGGESPLSPAARP
jgi:cbb3-type cytochrome oxidase maturation protein